MSAAELSTDQTAHTASPNHVDHAATSAEEATNQYLTFFLAGEEFVHHDAYLLSVGFHDD